MKKCWFLTLCTSFRIYLKRMRNDLKIHRRKRHQRRRHARSVHKSTYHATLTFSNCLRVSDWRPLLDHGVGLLPLHPLLGLLATAAAPLPNLGPGLRDQLHVQAGPDLGG